MHGLENVDPHLYWFIPIAIFVWVFGFCCGRKYDLDRTDNEYNKLFIEYTNIDRDRTAEKRRADNLAFELLLAHEQLGPEQSIQLMRQGLDALTRKDLEAASRRREQRRRGRDLSHA